MLVKGAIDVLVHNGASSSVGTVLTTKWNVAPPISRNFRITFDDQMTSLDVDDPQDHTHSIMTS